MNKFFKLILLSIAMIIGINTMLYAQAPQVIPYQAVAHDNVGHLIANQTVAIRFTVHDMTANGAAVYTEEQHPTTNEFGLFSAKIGIVSPSSFATINWGNGDKFMQVEIDVANGTAYVDMGTQQMMSVPYALYSGNGMPSGNAPGNMLYWDGSQWLKVAPGVNQQTLTYCDGVPTWGPCPPKPPTVTTNAIGTLSYNYADCGGHVTDGGFAPVTSRGICWSTSPNPTLADFSSTNGAGTGTGTFLVFAGNLLPGTTYYLRAFATNIAATSYGNEVSFTTLAAVVPTVNTQFVSSISYTSATVYGSLGIDGGFPVTTHGICWSTNPNPTLADNYMPDFFNNNPFMFDVDLYGLSQGTTYFVRAYATNSIGTGYGNELSFSTLGFSIPLLSTTIISGITSSTANSGGNITSGGGSPIIARGICYSTSPNPTTADSTIPGGTGTGSFNCTMTGLNTNTTYYVRSYATNTTGTGYGSEISFTSSPYTLGQSYGGGIICYIDGSTGQHGLIAAATDGPNSGNTFWGSIFPPVVATGTAIGTGASNTTALANTMGSPYPAWQCENYSAGGYADWFLPSQNECALMIQNKSYIGNMNNNGPYWTSTQISGSLVVAIGTTGTPFSVQHANVTMYYYRPVRAF